MPATVMEAWAVDRPGPIDDHPLPRSSDRCPFPGPARSAPRAARCGVCRTDLHLAEGDLAPRRPAVVPGHEVVGFVDSSARDCRSLPTRRSDRCAMAGAYLWRLPVLPGPPGEPLPRPAFTGWDLTAATATTRLSTRPSPTPSPHPSRRDGGSPALRRHHRLPGAAPFGAPGGGRLGIYGFGASAHLTAQIAIAEGASVHVLTRSAAARQLARELGAASVGDAYDSPPEPLDAAILFAPVGCLVPSAFRRSTAEGRSPSPAST